LGHHKKSLNYGSPPKIKDFMEIWNVSPFGPPIFLRRGGLWGKYMG
jgi:hypothetical protein